MKIMAVMRHVGFGCRDCGRPVLFFEAKTGEGGSLQIVDAQEAFRCLTKHNIYDIKHLEGATCWLESSDTDVRAGSTVKFSDLTGL